MSFIGYFTMLYLLFVVIDGLMFLCNLKIKIKEDFAIFKKMYPDESDEKTNERVIDELKNSVNYDYGENLYVHFVLIFIPIINIFMVAIYFLWCASKLLETKMVANIIEKINNKLLKYYFNIIDKIIKGGKIGKK